MEKTRYSLQPSIEENPAFLCLFPALHSNSQYPNPAFNFTTDSYFMERGPRYEAYSKLRESKLRKRFMGEEDCPDSEIEMPKPDLSPSPLKKSVKFQDPVGFPGPKRKSLRPPSSIVAQSVPDFSSALKKENRRPPVNRIIDKSSTPPPPMSKNSKIYVSGSKLGSRLVNSGERKTGIAARKSYANIEELKGLSAAASFSIAGAGQRVVGRNSVLGIRKSVQFC